MKKVVWFGDITVCDFCKGPFRGDVMYDANLGGPWGNVCQRCFDMHGCRLGTGFGQKYEKQKDGKWLKVGG